MVTTQNLLFSILERTQHSQHILSRAISSADSHSLKTVFSGHLQEYDRIESQIQIIAAQRGWDLPELQPALRWLTGFRFRHSIHNRCPDSSIAEYMIGQHTKDMICLLKLRNRWAQKDEQAITLLQKFLDCKTVNIRQMQRYL